MSAFTAVFRNGSLHPKTPLPLSEGEEIEVLIVPRKPELPIAPEGESPGQRAAAIMARIAAIRVETGPKEAIARNHDRYVYKLPREQ
jgi:hypothetical protein